MPGEVWDEITDPFPNFNGCTIEVLEWISNFIRHFIMDVINTVASLQNGSYITDGNSNCNRCDMFDSNSLKFVALCPYDIKLALDKAFAWTIVTSFPLYHMTPQGPYVVCPILGNITRDCDHLNVSLPSPKYVNSQEAFCCGRNDDIATQRRVPQSRAFVNWTYWAKCWTGSLLIGDLRHRVAHVTAT